MLLGKWIMYTEGIHALVLINTPAWPLIGI